MYRSGRFRTLGFGAELVLIESFSSLLNSGVKLVGDLSLVKKFMLNFESIDQVCDIFTRDEPYIVLLNVTQFFELGWEPQPIVLQLEQSLMKLASFVYEVLEIANVKDMMRLDAFSH